MSQQFFQNQKVDEAAQKDAADLLYRYGVGGLFISLLASSGLAFMAAREMRGSSPYVWWAAMLAVLAARALDQQHFRKTIASTKACGVAQIRRFGVGLIFTGILWAVFPLLFFTRIDQTGRAYTAIVVSGMVGGSATVLAPSRKLSFFYCVCLLLPASALFIFLGGTENTVLGILGCMFLAVMVLSSALTHKAIMSAIVLSRRNEALAAEMLEQRQLTENANIELKTAQLELSRINQSLESRIEARTADLAREIREKNQYAKDLAYLASTDSLTGILNRSSILKRIGDALALAELSEQRLAVLFLDLNKFKEVNDEMGHYAGDRVLRTIAQRLSADLPPQACLARWGGDEFVAVLPDITSATFAMTLAGVLRARIRDPIELDLGTTTVDVTVGIAMFPEHGPMKEDLIRAADMAMYDGKQHHVNIRIFEPSISRQLTERQSLERSLRRAVVDSALSLVFQPMIGVRGGRCEIVEALVRWHDPERGLMLPGEFIPLAERTGEINAIGRWVLMEACKEAATWKGKNPPAVSVNVSASQIDYGQLTDEVMLALKTSGLPPQRLQLELTESVFAGEADRIAPVLQQLRDSGISISLDDFGTGFSCLAYMHNLPIDMIKIDRSFVESVEVSAAPIIQTIVITAQTFGLKTVAEGVETVIQARSLVEMRCDYMQGYLFSNVLPPQAMRDWLTSDCPDGKISPVLWNQVVPPAAQFLSAAT